MVVRIKDGGTSQTTAEGARIALGLSDANIIAIVGTPAGAQPLDSDLTAIAALTTTSYGRSFLTLADASAGRTYLGLGTMATETASNYLTTASATATYLTISTAASTYIPLTGLTGAAGTNRIFSFSTAGTARWQLAADNVAESGASAGTGFAIWRYSDAGSFLGQPIYIQRSNGQIFFESPPSIGSDPLLASGAQTLTTAQKIQARTNINAAENLQSQPNRFTNPNCLYQQVVGTALSSANQTSRPVDTWTAVLVTSVAVVTPTRQLIDTPNGSVTRIRMVVNTIDASLAAGDRLSLIHAVEGYRMADSLWGTASAKKALIRFGFKGPAGTYSIGLRNGALDRAYTVNFTISSGQANTDTVQSFIVNGDTSGTWAKDNTAGMFFDVVLAAGSTFQGTAGAWQAAANTIATTSNTNGMGTVNNTFEMFDFELYFNNSGVFPDWVAPQPQQNLADCLRYYYVSSGHVVETNTLSQTFTLPVPMRIVPTVTGGGAGFTVAIPGNTTTHVYQTTRAYQALHFSATMV